MLLIPNRYASSLHVVDDGLYWHYLSNPLCVPKEQLPAVMFAEPSGAQGRGHDAVGDVTSIVLEYDGGKTPEDFLRENRGLVFTWYTTSSHTEDNPRFRVVLPLTEPVPFSDVRERRELLQRRFPGHDPMSVLNWQGLPNRLNAQYRWGSNAGNGQAYYDWSEVQQIARDTGWQPKQRVDAQGPRNMFGGKKQIRNVTAYADSIWRECLEKLWRIPTYSTGGKRRQRFYAVISKLASAQANGQFLFTDDEIMQLVMAHSPEQRRAKMVMSACRARGGRG